MERIRMNFCRKLYLLRRDPGKGADPQFSWQVQESIVHGNSDDSKLEKDLSGGLCQWWSESVREVELMRQILFGITLSRRVVYETPSTHLWRLFERKGRMGGNNIKWLIRGSWFRKSWDRLATLMLKRGYTRLLQERVWCLVWCVWLMGRETEFYECSRSLISFCPLPNT